MPHPWYRPSEVVCVMCDRVTCDIKGRVKQSQCAVDFFTGICPLDMMFYIRQKNLQKETDLE